MKYISLILAELKYAKLAKDGSDEGDVNIACYHCQQAMERLCSYACQVKGVKPIRTHNLEQWNEYLGWNEVHIPASLIPLLREVTRWWSESRYNVNFIATKSKIESVILGCEEWLPLLEPKNDKMNLF